MARNTFSSTYFEQDIGQLMIETVTTIENGIMAYVQTIDDSFLYDSTSTATPDGITIVAPQSNIGGGRWKRMGITSYRWNNQATWFVDPTNGNDQNNGATPSTALQTLAEWGRRLNNTVVDIAMTLTLLGSTPVTDNPYGLITIGRQGSLGILGSPTIVYTGSVTAQTATTPSTNVQQQITDSALPAANSWSTYINAAGVSGYRIRGTSGAINGAVTFPMKDLGAKAARVKDFMKYTADAVTVQPSCTLVVPVNGNTFVIEQMPSIANFNIQFMISGIGNLAFAATVYFKDLTFGGTDIIVSNSPYSTLGFFGCDMGTTNVNNGVTYMGCRFYTYIPASTYNYYYGCLFINYMVTLPGQYTLFDFRCAGQGSGNLTIYNPASIASIGWFDSSSHGIIFYPGGAATLGPIYQSNLECWGSGNTSYGIRVQGGTIITWSSSGGLPSIVGTAGAFAIASPSTNTAAWAGQLPKAVMSANNLGGIVDQ